MSAPRPKSTFKSIRTKTVSSPQFIFIDIKGNVVRLSRKYKTLMSVTISKYCEEGFNRLPKNVAMILAYEKGVKHSKMLFSFLDVEPHYIKIEVSKKEKS